MVILRSPIALLVLLAIQALGSNITLCRDFKTLYQSQECCHALSKQMNMTVQVCSLFSESRCFYRPDDLGCCCCLILGGCLIQLLSNALSVFSCFYWHAHCHRHHCAPKLSICVSGRFRDTDQIVCWTEGPVQEPELLRLA